MKEKTILLEAITAAVIVDDFPLQCFGRKLDWPAEQNIEIFKRHRLSVMLDERFQHCHRGATSPR